MGITIATKLVPCVKYPTAASPFPKASPFVTCSIWPRKRAPLSRRSVRAMGSSASSHSSDGFQETQIEDHSKVSDEEWRKRLTKEQYYIARQKGTERDSLGNTGIQKRRAHTTVSAVTHHYLTTKFDSGTGWPSFYESVGNNVKTKLDKSIIFMPRQEILCSTCDAHLGHVFDDGPPPSGKRYCLNSASLKLKPKQ